MKTRRNILLTNDDGIESEGLLALVGPLGGIAKLTVVAPFEERSGASHSIMYKRPVVCEERTLPGGVRGFAVDAFPADCVKLAIDRLMVERPDLVVSGMNRGANVGSHVFYSGTVAAALEASMMGVPGLAVSLAAGPCDFKRAAGLFLELLEMLDALDLGRAPAININIPSSEVAIRGVRWASQCAGSMPDVYEDAGSSDGRRLYQMRSLADSFEPQDLSDRSLLGRGYVTLTPLRCDLTCRDSLERLKDDSLSLGGRGSG
jgi:5'-nucleotidase